MEFNSDRVAIDARLTLTGIDAIHLEPQRNRVLKVVAQAGQCAGVRVYATQRRHAGNPVPRLIPFDLGDVPDVAHPLSHCLPRQGSRSRSIARSVPLGRSPLWIGMTV